MNKAIIAILTLAIVAGAGLVSAYRGDFAVKGPNYDEDLHEQIEAAMEANDFDTWKELMPGRMAERITEDNFETFVNMHEAMEDGDFDLAAEYREELGFGQGYARAGGRQGGMHGNCGWR